MKQLLILPLIALLSSCGQDTSDSHQQTDTAKYDCIIPPPDTTTHEEIDGMPEVINECYRYDKGDVHKSIQITVVQDSAWGNFSWGIDGKDGVKGEFTGNFRGDTLWIMYQAIIEGHLVPREVAFLRQGDKLYEAQGTQEENAKGVYYYKHKKMLEYNDPDPMVKGPCM